MRHSHIVSIAAALCLFTAPCLRAQVVLEVQSGRTYEGTVLSNDGKSVELQTTDGATITFPMEQFTLVSQYRLRIPDTVGDAKKQVALAEWCVEQKLYKEARNEFRKALKTDPDMEADIETHLAAARVTASKELLARGMKAQADNNPQEARRIFSAMVQQLPDEEASKEAAQLLEKETAERAASALSKSTAAASANSKDIPESERATRPDGSAFSDATRVLFAPVIDGYQKMLKATQKGLTSKGSSSIDNFESALKEGDRIRKAAEKIKETASPNDVEVPDALLVTDSKLEEADVDARINMVDCYLLRSSYNQASEVVKDGMALYPKNAELRATMDRVTAAATDDDDGNWTIARGRLGGGGRR